MSQSKVWFITGSGSGFGRIWAEAALKRGDRVAATDRTLKKLGDLSATYGDAILTLPLDVTDREAVFRTVNKAHGHFGRLDVIISAAGYGYMGAIEEVDFEDFRKNFETNVFGTLSVVQAAIPLVRAQRAGHILTVSSIGGLVSSPTGGSYVATKFAVEAMTEALAGEVAPFGIKVTAIEPGPFATNFSASAQSAPKMAEYDAAREATMAQFDAKMAGDPHATAAAILKLVDSDNPPIRLLLGSSPLPVIRQIYAKRLDTWNEWADVSNAAQGD